MLYEGSCHCGNVAFEVEGEFTEALDCNCSLCRRRGGLLAFVPREKLVLKTPEENVSTYTFNRHVIRHHFCANCGIAPFGEGVAPDGSAMASINLRCLPALDLGALKVTAYDGASR
ncbi:GFA family protein [Rhizobium lentis]|uniref:GFA family protein n=1 Tax=Rhizobium lentis TaxID=1138194 RepID=A0A9Q3QVK9_9HYPH|nr:GFA family protein [Rhizobium lentis]MBX4973551.1 GFA family protein [Rhizobium lentis]MBX5011895.1 GFA family protein [Rhizobium lentis]MBX5022279.1 GFA family protein [Rhizobium lentis]MBX5039950.1 GFA family protein [Rhizobium lentis]MBX5046277.1 GFA family protein [Rhizobium lentis]